MTGSMEVAPEEVEFTKSVTGNVSVVAASPSVVEEEGAAVERVEEESVLVRSVVREADVSEGRGEAGFDFANVVELLKVMEGGNVAGEGVDGAGAAEEGVSGTEAAEG